ncbi:MAG: SDR family NAD(P)-dependent oxidoreductase, partial [Betaproteobacteria bacterium]
MDPNLRPAARLPERGAARVDDREVGIPTGPLSGETAVITGGSRGIGLAIATAFAREGASVALVARSADELAAAGHAIEDVGGKVIARRADVTDQAAMSAVIDDVRAVFGPVTILVNNAGAIAPIMPFGESSLDDWWRCVEVNLRGPAVCTQIVIHEMAARGRGRIINLVSGAAIINFTNYSAYVASKTAVARWSESLAAELAPYGVQVFAMEPGTVATAMTEFSVTSPEGRRWIPWFKGVFEEGLDSPVERVAQRALDLALGKADVLSGCYIPLAESLEDLVRNAARIREEELYSLRMSRLVQSPSTASLRAFRARGEMASPGVVRLRRRLPVTAHEAFALWRDGDTVASWFLPPGTAEWLGPPTMEPRAGG